MTPAGEDTQPRGRRPVVPVGGGTPGTGFSEKHRRKISQRHGDSANWGMDASFSRLICKFVIKMQVLELDFILGSNKTAQRCM